MRRPEEVLHLVLSFAHEHDSIRAVVMNGSRVNPNVTKDPFQDFDIVYLVTSVREFTRVASIPEHFGEIMILQLPDDMGDPPQSGNDRYTYLMQFADGTRIDLGIHPVEKAKELLRDSLSVVLPDKDDSIGEIPPPSETSYLPKLPTKKAFEDCCNEFWWLNPYVAKGIWRDELPYAKHMMETPLRAQLIKMIVWDIAVRTNCTVSTGKYGKYLNRFMPPSEWTNMRETYADWNPNRMWEALITAGDVFRTTGNRVAARMGFEYPRKEDSSVSDYIRRIRQLPPDALEL
jgi:aminoglycoside 6-adenylyltransferase